MKCLGSCEPSYAGFIIANGTTDTKLVEPLENQGGSIVLEIDYYYFAHDPDHTALIFLMPSIGLCYPKKDKR